MAEVIPRVDVRSSRVYPVSSPRDAITDLLSNPDYSISAFIFSRSAIDDIYIFVFHKKSITFEEALDYLTSSFVSSAKVYVSTPPGGEGLRMTKREIWTG